MKLHKIPSTMQRGIAFFAGLWIAGVSANCYTPSPAFPVPTWSDNVHELQPVFGKIEKKLDQIISEEKYENVSFSIEVTTNTDTIWQNFHTARRLNESRPGTRNVDTSSQYRIASISKVFTTLAILYQHEAGNLSLDLPIKNYIPELSGPDAGDLPWKDISLRSLASQLSGIPRESSQSDVINYLDAPWKYGLPPASRDGLPTCNEYNNYKPCSRSDFLDYMTKLPPLFAPNQFSTYSNNAFILLGLAIENVTGMSYEDYVNQAIFQPLNLTQSTMQTPSDEHAVLPADGHIWDVDEGVANPTGGIYSSSRDLSRFLRYVLTHYNTLTTGVNWLQPASWGSGSMTGFYGMPWEIFRSDRILAGRSGRSGRPVTFVTKSGGLRGYQSRVAILEEYGLGITILVGASGTDVFGRLLETVTVELVRAAEEVVWRDVEKVYAGSYVAVETGLNSSLRLVASEAHGLTVEAFVSNGTEPLAVLAIRDGILEPPGEGKRFRAQAVPTLLFKNETTQEGEIWRVITVPEKEDASLIWDDFCIRDIDEASYAGLPLNEVVFWHEKGIVELPAWKLELKAEKRKSHIEGLVIQD